MTEELTMERLQDLITRAPYHQWLGLKVVALHDDGIELTAKWREEWVVSLERRFSHGGVLAALIDLGAQELGENDAAGADAAARSEDEHALALLHGLVGDQHPVRGAIGHRQ